MLTNYRKIKRLLSLLTLVAVLLTFMVSCKKDETDPIIDSIKPKGPKPAWGPTITPQMQTVIEKLESYGTPPLYTLTPQEARQAPTIGDAAMDVMKEYNVPMPPVNVDIVDKNIAVDKDQIQIRIYTPRTGKASYPVIVYYHGGGWVIATIDTYNTSAVELAQKTDAIVVSVEYRKGPEFKFPIAHNDAFEAYKWVLNNAASFKADAKRIAVSGESAGGNLAANVSIMARDKGIMMPLHQVLVYPVANGEITPSKITYKDSKPLSLPLLEWFVVNYLNSPAEALDPRISLVKADLKKSPSTTIIAAEIDVLTSEGQMLAAKYKEAGVAVTYKLYTGVTHEFFGLSPVIPEATKAQELAAKALKAAFK